MSNHNLGTVTSVIKDVDKHMSLTRKLLHLKDIKSILTGYYDSTGDNQELIQTIKECIEDTERDLRSLPSYLLSH